MLIFAVAAICGCAGQKPSQSEQIAQKVQALRGEVARVPDAARRQKLQLTVDRFEGELRSFDRSVREVHETLVKLNADPGTPRARFDEVLGRLDAERKVARAQFVRTHLEMVALTTEEEWRSIAKREAEVLELDDPAHVGDGK